MAAGIIALIGTLLIAGATCDEPSPRAQSSCFTRYTVRSSVKKYTTGTTKCGWFGRRRCSKKISYTGYQTSYKTKCCAGWYALPTCDKAICHFTCQNGGKCIRPNVCDCRPGWTGQQCHIPICHFTCQNGGKCISPNVCDCRPGWTGQQCHIPICVPDCLNGGTCYEPYKCNCTHEWIGGICETPRCLEKSTCLHGNWTSAAVCKCLPGWSGTKCDEPICSPTCKNKGRCIARDTCKCIGRWTGHTCDIPVCPKRKLMLGQEQILGQTQMLGQEQDQEEEVTTSGWTLN